jgi:hypothetical protein
MNKYLSFVIIFLLAISGFFTIVPTKTIKADTELTVTGNLPILTDLVLKTYQQATILLNLENIYRVSGV